MLWFSPQKILPKGTLTYRAYTLVEYFIVSIVWDFVSLPVWCGFWFDLESPNLSQLVGAENQIQRYYIFDQTVGRRWRTFQINEITLCRMTWVLRNRIFGDAATVNISNSEFDTHYVIVFSTKAVYKILPKGTLTYRAYTLVEYFFSLLTYTSTEYRQRERERERAVYWWWDGISFSSGAFVTHVTEMNSNNKVSYHKQPARQHSSSSHDISRLLYVS